MSDNDELVLVEDGIWMVPNPSKFFPDKQVISSEKVIDAKFLFRNGERVGYRYGIKLANQLGLTSQMAAVDLIKTNIDISEGEYIVCGLGIIIKKPFIEVTDENYKLLQVMDLLEEFNYYSELSLEEAAPILNQYISDVVRVIVGYARI